MKKKITYSDNFQKNYKYFITEPVGKNFDKRFKPDLSPKQMLKIGVFGGAYFIGVKGLIPKDLPKDWFKSAKLSKTNEKQDKLNFFRVSASQPLSIWKKKGWINPQDPHGWFEWYCRYYLGRRSEDDERQIKRWVAMKRHLAQVAQNCPSTPLGASRNYNWCRPTQRQALLHWGYDSRKI